MIVPMLPDAVVTGSRCWMACDRGGSGWSGWPALAAFPGKWSRGRIRQQRRPDQPEKSRQSRHGCFFTAVLRASRRLLACSMSLLVALLVALQLSHGIRIEVVAAVWGSSMRHV
jgi:hypothetical protein